MTQTFRKAWLRDPTSWRCPQCGELGGLTSDASLVMLLEGIGRLRSNDTTRRLAMRRPLTCTCGWKGKVRDVAQLTKPNRKGEQDEQG